MILQYAAYHRCSYRIYSKERLPRKGTAFRSKNINRRRILQAKIRRLLISDMTNYG